GPHPADRLPILPPARRRRIGIIQDYSRKRTGTLSFPASKLHLPPRNRPKPPAHPSDRLGSAVFRQESRCPPRMRATPTRRLSLATMAPPRETQRIRPTCPMLVPAFAAGPRPSRPIATPAV